MKSVFHLGLCLYLLLLSVLPCADSLVLRQPNKQVTRISADTHQHNTHQDSEDECSPLCVCSCCGIVLDTLPQFQFSYIQLQVDRIDCFGSPDTELSVLSFSSWQPPHIG